MTISKIFKRISVTGIMLGALAVSATSALAAFDGGSTCLPSGPGTAGLSTGVGFLPSWYARGHFIGIRVSELRAASHSVKIAMRNGSVLYSGPVAVGQFIPLSTYSNLVWTGYKSSYGTHMGGICVTSVYE